MEISTNYVAVLLTDCGGQPLWRQTGAVTSGSQQEVLLAQAEALLAAAIERAQPREEAHR